MANPYHTATIPLCHQEPNHAAQPLESLHMCRFGQNPIYTVYIRYFWQGNHRIYGHIRCIYTVLANPTYVLKFCTTNVATPHCTSSTSSAGRPAAGTLLKSLLTCVFLHNEPHHSTSPTKSAGKPAARTLLKSLLTCVFLHNEPHHSTSPTKSGGKPAAGTLLKSLLTCVLCTTSHTTQPHQLNLQASQRQGRCSNAYLRVCFLHTESHNSTASTSCAGRPAARMLLLRSCSRASPHELCQRPSTSAQVLCLYFNTLVINIRLRIRGVTNFILGLSLCH